MKNTTSMRNNVTLFGTGLVLSTLLVSVLTTVPVYAQGTSSATAVYQTPATTGQKALPDPARWETTIRKFEKADAAVPPAQNSVLFYGSSSMVNWKTLREDFPNMATLNRGFGGSNIPEANYYTSRIVIPYRPRAIVFYSGDNDIAQDRTPQQVAEDFKIFVGKVRAGGLTDVPILYVAIKPSIARWKLRDKIKSANGLIKEWAGTQPGGKVIFVDIWDAMLGTNGEPRPELYVKDGLHMTREGYKIWTAAVAPALNAALKPTEATP